MVKIFTIIGGGLLLLDSNYILHCFTECLTSQILLNSNVLRSGLTMKKYKENALKWVVWTWSCLHSVWFSCWDCCHMRVVVAGSKLDGGMQQLGVTPNLEHWLPVLSPLELCYIILPWSASLVNTQHHCNHIFKWKLMSKKSSRYLWNVLTQNKKFFLMHFHYFIILKSFKEFHCFNIFSPFG